MTAQPAPLSIARTWRPSSGASPGCAGRPDDEHRLIEASRKARDQQEKTEARNKTVRRVVQIAFAVLFLILAGVTVWASRAQADATLKTAETLTQSGINALEQEHTFEAMHLLRAGRFHALFRRRPRRITGSGSPFSGQVTCQHFDPFLGTRGRCAPPRSARTAAGRHRLIRSDGAGLERADGKRIAELKGHAGGVTSAAFSPDGGRVVTASVDGTARVWSPADGKRIAELKGHASGAVTSAAFSPDGARVVTASGDGTARVWSAADGKRIAELKGHAGAVTSAAFSPDGAGRHRLGRRDGAGLERGRWQTDRRAEGARGRGDLRRVQPGRHAGRHRLRRSDGAGLEARPMANGSPS